MQYTFPATAGQYLALALTENVDQINAAKITIFQPDGTTLVQATTNSYDTAGNLVRTTDGDNNYTLYSYDAAGNVVATEVHAADGTLISDSADVYDQVGRLITSVDGDGNIELRAAAPEMRRGAAHRLVSESETNKMAVGGKAEGGEGFEIARSQIEEIHLLCGVAGNRVELGPVLREHTHGSGKARHDPREGAGPPGGESTQKKKSRRSRDLHRQRRMPGTVF